MYILRLYKINVQCKKTVCLKKRTNFKSKLRLAKNDIPESTLFMALGSKLNKGSRGYLQCKQHLYLPKKFKNNLIFKCCLIADS